MAEPIDWLKVRQGAVRAQAGPKTIYRAIRAGELRAARIGGRREYRLRPEWIDQWLEASAAPAPVKPR